MVKVNWTNKALADIDSIATYIAQESPHFARLQAVKFFTRVEQLTHFPKSGKIVPEFNSIYLRELIEGNYRIVYRIINKEEIHIVRVHHSAMPLRRKYLR
ncbi:MAG: type II toxin-antitoxin system RelE/ParE family toxin [Sphingobacteriales bacterium JAD_PAG50586_3]|nr:MAG: type II toxin-antitoxin system RelE/ParE family toxin [Sphingobacteriales bacterium JAD_PAG50586_3]